MTSEQISEAIERLRGMKISSRDFIIDVCRAFLGGEVTGDELHYTLIELLEQVDPDTHMELPKDYDGQTVRIGDKVEHLYNGRWGKPFEIVELWLRPSGWMVRGENGAAVNVETCRHHRKPTVEDLLRECCDAYAHFERTDFVDDAIAEYAAKLRKVIADE